MHVRKFVVREAGDFRTFLLHFIYHHNSYLLSGIPQIYVAANKNTINNPVLLWNKHLPSTCIFTYPYQQTSLRSLTKVIGLGFVV